MPTSGETNSGSLTIGAVIDELKGDFPDLTISKIRFLESKGLVKPARAASGYRRFRPSDVERLRYILTAQRDHFWPLKVIQQALDALERGLTPAGPAADSVAPTVPAVTGPDNVPPAATLTSVPARLRLTSRELSATSGLSEAMIGELTGFGLLTPDSRGYFDAMSVPVAKAVAALSSYGIEPRHLRPFRTAADREIGLVEQVVSPMRGRADEDGNDVVGQLLHECLTLHASLVRAGLARRT